MKLGHRIALTFAILLAILLAMALFSFMGGRWEEAPGQAITEVDLYGDQPLDAALLALDRRALDESYHAQLLKLWSVWLADGAKNPDNFQRGLANARRAYGLALHAITKREQKFLDAERQRRGEP
jgi:hypothetical protein